MYTTQYKTDLFSSATSLFALTPNLPQRLQQNSSLFHYTHVIRARRAPYSRAITTSCVPL